MGKKIVQALPLFPGSSPLTAEQETSAHFKRSLDQACCRSKFVPWSGALHELLFMEPPGIALAPVRGSIPGQGVGPNWSPAEFFPKLICH